MRTVLQTVTLADTLEARPARALSLVVDPPVVPADETNLVLRAARALRDATGARGGAALRLTKRIPAGAGLGGGSSDAAGALKLLARLWSVRPRPGLLEELARALGSDVPFFLRGGTALATGRGDTLQRLPPLGTLAFVVLVPPFGVSTRRAYGGVRWLTRRRRTSTMPAAPSLVEEAAHLPGTGGRGRLHNTFETTVFAAHPRLAGLKRRLIEAGAADAALTGTGSAVFGVAHDRAEARRIASRCAENGLSVYVAEPVRRGVRIAALEDSARHRNRQG